MENNERSLSLRDLYLKKLLTGEIAGPLTGKPSIDKPWLQYYSDHAIETNLPEMTCYEYLRNCNNNFLNRTALSYFGRKIKFEELFKKIDEVAKSLKSMGIKENDIITISLPNIPEAVYLFYACSKIGAIANMVDPRTSEKGIKEYITEASSRCVFIIDSYYNKVQNLLTEGILDRVVAISPSESLPLLLNLGYKTKVGLQNIKNPETAINYDGITLNWNKFLNLGMNYRDKLDCNYYKGRPLVIEHTGGTTGKPKGVLLSNDNINSVALQSVLTDIDMQRTHNWLDIMPTFIAYGVGMGLHLPLTIGMETILIPQFDPQKFDELLVKHKPIHMVGVPSYWGTIINSKKLQKSDLSYIIAPTVGGDSMDTKLEVAANKFLREHNCKYKITKGYGMTEVTGGVAGTVDKNNEIGSVGIPFVKTTIAIFDPITNEELVYNKEGEVCITGPNTMLGYFQNEAATNDILKVHADGTKWIHSGDIGYITDNGSLFIVDRLKRMIIRYDGFKVFPSLIENVILLHPAVKTCKVVGINDKNHSQGKLPKAHIVLKDEYQEYSYELINSILEEIKQLCLEKLPEYAIPCDYKIREELPLTSIGKVDFISLENEDNIKPKTKTMKTI